MDSRSALGILFPTRIIKRLESMGGLDDPKRLAALLSLPPGEILAGREHEKFLAALHLSSIVNENAPLPPRLSSPEEMGKYYSARLGGLAQEHCYAVYTTLSGDVCGEKLIGVGSVDMVTADPRDILRDAVSNPQCAALGLVHNHPSGEPTPSDVDVQSTMRLVQAAALCGVKFTDHVVVSSRGRWQSVGEYMVRQISSKPRK